MIGVLLFSPAALADFAQDFNTATYFYKKSEYDLAARAFERLATEFPRDPRLDAALYWAGESHNVIGNYADAHRSYKRLAREFPESDYNLKAQLAAARTAMKLGEYKTAEEFYGNLVKDARADSDLIVTGRIGHAESLLKQGLDLRAEMDLREFLAIDKLPRKPRLDAELRLRQVLIRLGRVAESRAMLAAAPKNSPHYNAEDQMAKADAAFAENRFGVAAVIYEKISVMDDLPPEFRARAAYQHARCLMSLGQPDKARDILTRIGSGGDALPDVLAGTAMQMTYLYRDQKMTAQAVESAKVVERIAAESGRPDLKKEALFFRAEDAFRKKNYAAALAILSEMNESTYRVNRLMGRIYLESGRVMDAAVYLDRASALAPDDDARNQNILDLAGISFGAKDFDQTLTTLSRIQRPSADIESRMRPLRAESFLQLGRFKDAAREYGQLAAATPDRRLARQYRYNAVIASFKDRNLAWAERLLKDLDALGGIPNGDRDDPAAFLDAASQIDNAVEFAVPEKDDQLQKQIDAILGRLASPAPSAKPRAAEPEEAASDTQMLAFVIDRLRARDRYKILPKYTALLLKYSSPVSDIYGKTAYDEVTAYARQKNWPAALSSLEALEKWVERRPSSDLVEEAKFLRPHLTLNAGDDPAAMLAFQEYLDRYPSGKYAAKARYHLGNRALKESRLEEAENEFSKLAAQNPGQEEPDASTAEARYNLALIRIQQKRYPEAAELLSALAAADAYKTDPEFRNKLAQVYLSMNRPKDAEPHLRLLIQNPKTQASLRDPAIASLLGALYQSKQYARLEQDLRNFSGLISDLGLLSQSRFYTGTILFQKEQFADAAASFDAVRAPAGSEQVKDARLRRADCDYYLKRYSEALDRYEKIVREFPRSQQAREALFSSGLCKIKLGQSQDALDGFEKFLQQNPEASLAPSAAIEAAGIYLNLGDLDAAEEKLKFLDQHPNQTLAQRTMWARITLFQKRGQMGEYLNLAKTYLKTYGMDFDIAVSAAVAATGLGVDYDPFDLGEARDIGAATKKLEDMLTSAALAFKTFTVDERFLNTNGLSLDFEEAFCTLRRVIFTDARVFLIVEAKSVSFTTKSSTIRVKNVVFASIDLPRTPGSFLSGIQLKQDIVLPNDRPRYFVVSVPRRQWSDSARLCLDGVGFRAGSYCYAHTHAKGAWDR